MNETPIQFRKDPAGPVETRAPRSPLWIAVLLLLAGLGACDSGPAADGNAMVVPDPPVGPSERLLWPAPSYTKVLHVPFVDHEQNIVLDDDHDYRVVLPDTALTHRLNIWGGHNIQIIGGTFRLKGYAGTDSNKAALVFWYGDHPVGETRVVHLEGVLFDMSDARDRDALALRDEQAIFQIQNVRFQNVNGDHIGLHPDAIENWGGAKEVRIYRATVITEHQGFMLSPHSDPGVTNPLEYVDIRKVDFRRNDGVYDSFPNHKCPIYMWLVQHQSDNCETFERGAFLDEVYATHADKCWDFGMNDTVPNTLQPADCLAAVNESGTEISWPTLPFTGVVKLGPPPAGEFVAEDAVGIGYRSPGYVSN